MLLPAKQSVRLLYAPAGLDPDGTTQLQAAIAQNPWLELQSNAKTKMEIIAANKTEAYSQQVMGAHYHRQQCA